jgi:hypothetical protein
MAEGVSSVYGFNRKGLVKPYGGTWLKAKTGHT